MRHYFSWSICLGGCYTLTNVHHYYLWCPTHQTAPQKSWAKSHQPAGTSTLLQIYRFIISYHHYHYCKYYEILSTYHYLSIMNYYWWWYCKYYQISSCIMVKGLICIMILIYTRTTTKRLGDFCHLKRGSWDHHAMVGMAFSHDNGSTSDAPGVKHVGTIRSY